MISGSAFRTEKVELLVHLWNHHYCVLLFVSCDNVGVRWLSHDNSSKTNHTKIVARRNNQK